LYRMYIVIRNTPKLTPIRNPSGLGIIILFIRSKHGSLVRIGELHNASVPCCRC
jgi:hypothetical protein